MATCEDMVPLELELLESDGRGVPARGQVKRLCQHGMEAALEVPPSCRFAWLEFVLPSGDEDYRVKALGEVVEVDTSKVVFRFKHLFPNDRLALESFLSRVAA